MASIGKCHTPTTLNAHSSKAKHARDKRPARRESQEKTTTRSCQYLSSSPSRCRATLLLGEIFDFCQVCWSVPFVCLSVCRSVSNFLSSLLIRSLPKLYGRLETLVAGKIPFLVKIGPRSRSRSDIESKTPFWH